MHTVDFHRDDTSDAPPARAPARAPGPACTGVELAAKGRSGSASPAEADRGSRRPQSRPVQIRLCHGPDQRRPPRRGVPVQGAPAPERRRGRGQPGQRSVFAAVGAARPTWKATTKTWSVSSSPCAAARTRAPAPPSRRARSAPSCCSNCSSRASCCGRTRGPTWAMACCIRCRPARCARPTWPGATKAARPSSAGRWSRPRARPTPAPTWSTTCCRPIRRGTSTTCPAARWS